MSAPDRPAHPQTGEPNPGAGVDSDDREDSGRESAELLEAIRRGDPGAFETVARRTAPRLLRLAMSMTRNRADAEDLVQETLLRSLPHLRRFEGRARISTYLIRALGNQWKNRLRSRKRSRLVEWFGRGGGDAEPERALDPPAEEPSAQELLEREERAGDLHAAIEKLEPTRRWTLLLREVEGLSYEEIGEATGVPTGTVRSRLARARADLRAILKGER